MSKVKVLFFAADPLSAPPDGGTPRLLLDEDVRRIREKVRAAEHRDALEFDVRWAARTDDLLQALNETRPQVVHFSGHGGNEGLVLVGADGGGPHSVDAAALGQLFQVFKGDIRVAVLNACFSLPQARAIAGAVGCAIGTRAEISDAAAITFGASFYRAIAFGQSVQAAYDQARTALALEHFEDRECPQLVVRPGVDPARLVLVAGGVDAGRRGARRVRTTLGGLVLAGAAVAASVALFDRTSGSGGSHPPADSMQLPTPATPADSVPVAAPGTLADTLRTPDSTPATPPTESFRFDPGTLQTYFQVSPGSIVTREFTDPLGRVSNLRAFEVMIQARRSFSSAAAIFFAYFYDADGIEIERGPVGIEPTGTDWEPGMRGRATIILPVENTLSRVRLIQIKDLYGA